MFEHEDTESWLTESWRAPAVAIRHRNKHSSSPSISLRHVCLTSDYTPDHGSYPTSEKRAAVGPGASASISSQDLRVSCLLSSRRLPLLSARSISIAAWTGTGSCVPGINCSPTVIGTSDTSLDRARRRRHSYRTRLFLTTIAVRQFEEEGGSACVLGMKTAASWAFV